MDLKQKELLISLPLPPLFAPIKLLNLSIKPKELLSDHKCLPHGLH